MKKKSLLVLTASLVILTSLCFIIVIEIVQRHFFYAPEQVQSAPHIATDGTVIDNRAYPKPRAAADYEALLAEPIGRPTKRFTSLLTKTSFEQNPQTSLPVWRMVGQGNDSSIEWTAERAATGIHALKISAVTPSNRGWPGWQADVDYQGKHDYSLQAVYYTPDGANAWLDIAFLDINNRLLTGFSTGCHRTSVTRQWTLVQHTVKAQSIPQASRKMRIGLRQCLNHTKGRRTTLYFDDVTLRAEATK